MCLFCCSATKQTWRWRGIIRWVWVFHSWSFIKILSANRSINIISQIPFKMHRDVPQKNVKVSKRLLLSEELPSTSFHRAIVNSYSGSILIQGRRQGGALHTHRNRDSRLLDIHYVYSIFVSLLEDMMQNFRRDC